MESEAVRKDARRLLAGRPLTRRSLLTSVAAAGTVLLVGLQQATESEAQQAPSTGPTATVNSNDGLNLRSGPGENYDVVTVMPGGAQVTETGTATPDNWVPVQYNGQSGWADGVYLTSSTTAPAAVSMTVLPADGLNLRGGPGTDQAVLVVLPAGATVSVIDAPTNGWVPVTYSGKAGWVMASYLGTAGAAGTGAATASGTGPVITSAATSSSGGATLAAPGSVAVAVAGGAAASTTTAAFGSAAMGTAGPPETGLTPVPAPSGAAGKFSWPVDSREITTIFQPLHQAIDISQPTNSPARAIADGIVSFAGGDPTRSYGYYVIVQHAGGYASLYAHFSSIEVQQGQAVKQGQEIGRTGSTGRSTGPHIHFPIYYQGMPLDPLTVLTNDGVQIEPGANDVA